MKEVLLPRNAAHYSVKSVVAALRPTVTTHDRVVVDWDRNQWIDPAGLVLLTAYLIHVQRVDGATVEFRNFSRDSWAARMGIKVLSDMDDDYPYRRRRPRDRFVEMRRLRREDEYADFSQQVPQVLRLGGIAAELAEYSLREMLTNVGEHAWSPCNAVVAAQHYPNQGDNGRTVYAVADTGHGIVRKVRERHAGVDTAVDAIEMAMRPGFTTSTDEHRNAGLGLPISREMAVRSGGTFRVLSGSALVLHNRDGRYPSAVESWQGTAVFGTLPAYADVSAADVIDQVLTDREATNGG